MDADEYHQGSQVARKLRDEWQESPARSTLPEYTLGLVELPDSSICELLITGLHIIIATCGWMSICFVENHTTYNFFGY